MKKINIDKFLPIFIAIIAGIGTTISAIKDSQKTEKIDQLIEKVEELTNKKTEV